MRKISVKQSYVLAVVTFVAFIIFSFLAYWTSPNFKSRGSIKIYDKNGLLLFESYSTHGKNEYAAYNEFPKYLINAVISSEDATFWQNSGIDLKGIVRAFVLNIQEKQILYGASTITQQLARIEVFEKFTSENKSFVNKVREVITAFRLNLSYSKEQILQRYLNSVYLGNNLYGFKSASRQYFNKEVSNLSLAESAFLTGLIQSPEVNNPYDNFSVAQEKQKKVLDLMFKNNYISNEESIAAKEEVISINNYENTLKAPHFVQYALDELKNTGITREKIKVFTTLDYYKYQKALEVAKRWVTNLRDKHNLTNASLILLNNKTGEIEVMVGGIDFYDKQNSGESNMTTALRQPGSAIKPITYAAAFMQGFTPATPLNDVETVFRTKSGEGFTPRNYDNKFHGVVLAREALASSLNVPAVEMLSKVGIENFVKTAAGLGITTFKRPDDYDLAITLGGGEVNLLELSNAYATFARGGFFIKTHSINKIEDDDNNVLFLHKQDTPKQALGQNGEKVSYLISDILSDKKARMLGFGEKNVLNLVNNQAAVKTGTTTDWHDIWTVGYTPSYTTGVWVGNNNNEPMKEISGVTGAGPIWNSFFEEILKTQPPEKFIKPDGLVDKWICKETGLPVAQNCNNSIQEIFISGTEPRGQEIRNHINELMKILYPKNEDVFETAPNLNPNESIVFKINISNTVSNFKWTLDGKILREATTMEAGTYEYSWKPIVGTHTLGIFGANLVSGQSLSDQVQFKVTTYNNLDE